ncbi:MAG: TetR/AcrR family transcriptional regulator [Burkholderiaceae bacterium]
MSKANHREKILSAGLAVFHEHGFNASGVQDVVDHAGVPKGSFYNHFKSKEALGLEVLESYWRAGSEVRLKLHAPGVAPLKRIDRHLAAIGYLENGCLVGNFSAELSGIAEIRARLVDLYKVWIDEVAACIREGQLDGTIRDNTKAADLAEFVIEGMQGAILKAKIDQDPAVFARYRKSIRLFLQSP